MSWECLQLNQLDMLRKGLPLDPRASELSSGAIESALVYTLQGRWAGVPGAYKS